MGRCMPKTNSCILQFPGLFTVLVLKAVVLKQWPGQPSPLGPVSLLQEYMHVSPRIGHDRASLWQLRAQTCGIPSLP